MGTTVHTTNGRFVDLTPTEFYHLVHQLPQPDVVVNTGETGAYHYVVHYQGLIFQTQSPQPLKLPGKRPVSTATTGWLFTGRIGREMMPPVMT